MLFPLRVWKRALRDSGIVVGFHGQLQAALFDCDVLIVDSKFHRDRWAKDTAQVVDEFNDMRAKVPHLVYFDTTDSTGYIQAELLPIVDRYCKNQILRDRASYKRSFYGHRIYADYYHQRDGVEDRAPISSDPITDEGDLAKITVGWNSGLSNYSEYGPFLSAGYSRFPWDGLLGLSKNFSAPDENRPNALQCRMGLGQNRETVTHQRRRIRDMLGRRVSTDKLGRFGYFRELRRSWAVLSPFGLGEITLKDYEVFLTGGLLVKPSMDHLETWPHFFEAGSTYVPFRWDLSDLEAVLDRVASDRKHFIAVAHEGQKRYREATIGEKAASSFVTHLRSTCAF